MKAETARVHPLHDPVELVRGVGPQRAQALARLEIHTLRDLLYHLPRRYEDRRHFAPLAMMTAGEMVTARGVVIGTKLARFRGGSNSMVSVVIQEGGASVAGGAQLTARWFNVPYFQNFFNVGDDVIFYGKLKLSTRRQWTMDHPDFEILENGTDNLIHINRIVPVHPAGEGLTPRLIRSLVWRCLEEYGGEIGELLPPVSVRKFGFPTLETALRQVHFPQAFEEATAGRNRLAFDELFLMQLVIALKREQVVHLPGIVHEPDGTLTGPFLQSLPFEMTAAQKRVVAEVETDLRRGRPMNRLLQGDVGSGKTLVAAHAMLQAVESGYQAALMAPTEILAEQHFLNLRRWFEPLGVRVILRTGSLKTGEQTPGLFESGNKTRPPVFVGTHALIESSVEFHRLGLVVVDEQHKFGVVQRARLTAKGQNPDVLVMTATPIPRTLSLTVYGDLDVSVLDELPRGRGEIITAVRTEKKLPEIFDFIKKQVGAGRQAYIVYALIDESDKLPLKSVLKEYETLQKQFPGISLGLLHGRLKSVEKEEVMKRFRSGQTQILVATTVIEVGVDVPNANLMLVENAERFGLSQLHQLRGRIGRGSHKSYCILVGQAKSPESFRRLRIMEETLDGFRIAEEDLRLRGPGNIFGTEQSGLPPLKIADLLADTDLLNQARAYATDIIAADPRLKSPDGVRWREALRMAFSGRAAFLTVG
ncbi:MAG: ATP-dependent DNA helicase RecG [Verrucomicrobiae bacterium]|nr:ATP-dependent DNA helicase RecG [Verrucomicrobiae bacterium]